MKKLLNVRLLRRIIAIIVIAVALIGIFHYKKEPCRVAAYDYRVFDSFRGGMPDYGLYKRRNILPTI